MVQQITCPYRHFKSERNAGLSLLSQTLVGFLLETRNVAIGQFVCPIPEVFAEDSSAQFLSRF